MSTPFTDFLAHLGRAEPIFRLAYDDGASGFRSTPVPAPSVDQIVEHLNNQNADVWWEVQPSSHHAVTGRSSAEHIQRVALLYADLDYKPKPSGLGSLPEAMDVIADLEGALGVPAAAIVHSGHGVQPYWIFEGAPITDETRSAEAILLRRWGLMVSMFAGHQNGAVDNVYDLPRILRVPGTRNWKDRAHPVEVTVELRPNPVAVDVELLREAFDDYQVPEPSSDHLAGPAAIVSPHAEWNWAETDCPFVATALTEIAESVPNSRHHWALKWAAIIHGMIRGGCVTESGFQQLQQRLIERFHWLVENEGTRRKAHAREVAGIMRAGLAKAEAWDSVKLAQELRQHVHPDTFRELIAEHKGVAEPARMTGAPVPGPEPSTPPSPRPSIFAQPVTIDPTADAYLRSSSFAVYSDTDNAAKLATWLKGRFIHVAGIGWHRWNGHRYEPDSAGLVIEEAKRMVIRMGEVAQVEKAAKWAHASLSGSKLSTMIKLATTVDVINVATTALDASAEELNTPAGVVNLRTGELRRADPKTDLSTLATHVAPDRIETPRWDAFLSWAMAEDTARGERSRYLQRIVGTALIGDLRWHIFPVLTGSGGNGKSVVLDLMLSLLGDYGHLLPRKFFVEKRGEAHPTDIAALRGKRLAVASEVPPGAAFDEDLVKTVTGESRLTGRFMREDFFTFKNTTTFVLTVNHLPSVRAGGDGFWRRVRKLDFTQHVAPDQQNPYLVQELLELEGPGIMQWAVDGAVEVIANGLQDPASVMRATREYRLQEDAIARFIGEVLIEVAGISNSRDAVYSAYRNWTLGQGIIALPQPAFEREIIQAVPGSGAKPGVFTGVALASKLIDDLVDEQ